MTTPPAIIMDAILPNKGTAISSITSRAAELISRWQEGQILQGRAESASDAAGRLLLAIGNQRVSAIAPFPIKPGQRFQLEVLALDKIPVLKILNKALPPAKPDLTPYLRLTLPRQSDPAPLLQRLISLTTSAPPLTPRLMEKVQTVVDKIPAAEQLQHPGQLKSALGTSGQFLEGALKIALGGSTPPTADFKSRLLQLKGEIRKQLAPFSLPPQTTNKAIKTITDTTTDSAAKPPETRQFQELLGLFRGNRLTLPQLASALTRYLTTDQLGQLQQALADYRASYRQTTSGNTLVTQVIEAIRQKTAPSRTAATLLQLLRTLPLLQDLQQYTDGALARLQSNQMLTANRDGGTFFLLLDLPLRHADEANTVQLQFERESAQDVDQEEAWQVSLNFDLPALGPLQVKVQLQGRRLQTRFLATQAVTESKIRQHLPRLQEALGTLGLQVDTPAVALEPKLALRPVTPPNNAPQGIVDEMA